MEPLRVVLVGAGILGRRYARVLHELEETRLVAVVNRTLDRAVPLAAAHAEPAAAAPAPSQGAGHGAGAFDRLSEALDAVDCDAVVVATADHVHAAPVLAALERGLDVMVEKPLTTVLAEARGIVARAREGARIVQVNHSQRRVEDYRWIHGRVRGGAIGTPRLVQHVRHDRIDVPTEMIAGWAEHTSPLFFMSSHDLDLVSWFLDRRPVRVAAQEHRGVLERRGLDVHDAVDALLTYDDGATAAFHTSWIHPRSHPALAFDRFTVVGESGSLAYDGRTRRAELHGPEGEEVAEFTGVHTANEVEGRLQGAFVESVRAFVRCVRERAEPPTSAAAMLPLVEAQDAILASIREGRPVELAAAPDPQHRGSSTGPRLVP